MPRQSKQVTVTRGSSTSGGGVPQVQGSEPFRRGTAGRPATGTRAEAVHACRRRHSNLSHARSNSQCCFCSVWYICTGQLCECFHLYEGGSRGMTAPMSMNGKARA
jgi:hypothetical protein